MRITSRQLRRIIQEEVVRMMDEAETGEETIVVDPKTGAPVDNRPKMTNPILAKKTAELRKVADDVKSRVEGNTLFKISLGTGFSAPFAASTGEGLLKITVNGPGVRDAASAGAPASSATSVRYELFDKSGAKLELVGDGRQLFNQVTGRIKRKLPDVLPPLAFVISMPFKWSQGNVTVGVDDGRRGFGGAGGVDYTADKVLGGVALQGIGFR
jgi:hypothetical protein